MNVEILNCGRIPKRVKCPNCKKIVQWEKPKGGRNAKYRLMCPSCGFAFSFFDCRWINWKGEDITEHVRKRLVIE